MTAQTSPPGPAASPVDGPYAWYRLGLSLVLSTIGSVGMWGIVVALPVISTEFGVDRGDASLPYSMTMLGFAFGNFFLGRYVDRLGITLPLIGAATALGTGYALAAMTTALWQFALIQGLLIGVGTSAGFGPLIADVSHWFHRRRGIAVATTASGNYLAGTLWPPVLEHFIHSDGWRATYVGVGIFCIAIMVPLSLMLRRPPPHGAHYVRAGGKGFSGSIALQPRTLQIMLMAAGVGCCVAMSMPQVHIVAYAKDLGYGMARGAEMLSVMFAGGLISRLVAGVLADYIGGVRTLLLGSVLQCAALLLYLPFDGPTSLYVVSLLFGLSQGGIVPSYAIIVRQYLPAREAGHRIGLVIMSTIIGMALGGWMSGWIYDLTGSYQAAFLNGIAWNLFNISIVSVLLWRTRVARTVPA